MKKSCVLFLIGALLFSFSACTSVNENSQSTVPLLESSEYWEAVSGEIIAMLNSHGLYVHHIDTRYPYVNIFVEPGQRNDDGKLVAVGLSQTQYEELYECVTAELHIVLDKYKLAKPRSIFHGCYSISGIFFYNWFFDEHNVQGPVISSEVASYQLDLLKYYYDHEEDSYMKMEGIYENKWSGYEVYTP